MGRRARLKELWLGFAVVWTHVWGWLAISALAVSVPQWTGLDPDPDWQAGVIATAFCTAMAGLGLVVARPWRREPVEVPPPRRPAPPEIWLGERPRLPRPRSAARQPARRLAEAEVALAELLRRLRTLPDGPVLPDDVITHTWHVATGTAGRLRSVAARIELVEIAAEQAPAAERAVLENGAGHLLAHLHEGIEGYRALIAAAGQLLLAATPDPNPDELVDATERLAGLAGALTELAAAPPVTKRRLAGAERETRGAEVES